MASAHVADDCITAFLGADESLDQRITRSEFISFIQSHYGTEVCFPFIDIPDTGKTPFWLQTVFNALSCFCQTSPDCCVGENAHIASFDTPDIAALTPQQIEHLTTVCIVTDSAIQMECAPLTEVPSPTMEPTWSMEPAPTSSPVGMEPAVNSGSIIGIVIVSAILVGIAASAFFLFRPTRSNGGYSEPAADLLHTNSSDSDENRPTGMASSASDLSVVMYPATTS